MSKFIDELVAPPEPSLSMNAFWEVLKIEIRNLNTIGEKKLKIASVRGHFCPHGPGIIPLPVNYTSLPKDTKAFSELIKPLCEDDGLGCKYQKPDDEGDGEGILITW